jgi:hypothetical protein
MHRGRSLKIVRWRLWKSMPAVGHGTVPCAFMVKLQRARVKTGNQRTQPSTEAPLALRQYQPCCCGVSSNDWTKWKTAYLNCLWIVLTSETECFTKSSSASRSIASSSWSWGSPSACRETVRVGGNRNCPLAKDTKSGDPRIDKDGRDGGWLEGENEFVEATDSRRYMYINNWIQTRWWYIPEQENIQKLIFITFFANNL